MGKFIVILVAAIVFFGALYHKMQEKDEFVKFKSTAIPVEFRAGGTHSAPSITFKFTANGKNFESHLGMSETDIYNQAKTRTPIKLDECPVASIEGTIHQVGDEEYLQDVKVISWKWCE